MTNKAELEKHYKVLAAQYFAALVELVGEPEARRIFRNLTLDKSCRHCRSPFQAGGGADRRADAKFCRDTCRKQFNNDARGRQ